MRKGWYKSTWDKKGVALQRWCSGIACDGCEHLSIAWPGTVSVTHYPYIVAKPLVTDKPVRCQNTEKPSTRLPAKSLFMHKCHHVKHWHSTKTWNDQRCFRLSWTREMETGSLIWRQYRASVWLKPYPTKHCSSAHNRRKSCHCITFAKPSLSCLLYFLYRVIPISRILNLENFYLLVSLKFYCAVRFGDNLK